MPASDLFTRSTWLAWSSKDKLRCKTPIPPCLAIAMASLASVTVSMAEERRGMLISTLLVTRVLVIT